MKLERLPIAEIGRLHEIDVGAQSEPWVREAEHFLFGGELAEFARRYQDELFIWTLGEDGVIVAVGVEYPDQRFEAIRLGVIVVDQRHRGRGLGSIVLHELVSTHVAKGTTALWLVHPLNRSMLKCSRRLEPKPDEATVSDGYIMFVAP